MTIRDADVVAADHATMNDWGLEGGEVLAGHELRPNRLGLLLPWKTDDEISGARHRGERTAAAECALQTLEA